MKKITFCILSVMLLLLYSCSDYDTLKPGQKDDQQGIADDLNARKVKGPLFTVEPSGDLTGIEDTDNLLQAFTDAKAAGPGAVVQLVSGQYTIGMIEIHDFDGYFRGAGKGKTVISNAPDLPCNDYWAIDNIPFLLQFVGGNITISDMTLRINDGVPCADHLDNPWRSYFGDLMVTVLVLADYTQTYVPSNRYIKGIVNNVDIIAGDIEDGYNVFGLSTNTNMTIYCGNPFMVGTGNEPLSNGEISITGCRFEQAQIGPDFAGFGENAMIKIENNVMTGTFYGMFMYCNLGSKFTIRNNSFIEGISIPGVSVDLYIDDNDYGYYPNEVLRKRTEWNISGNIFQASPGVISIQLGDYRRTYFPDEGFPQLFDIKFNTFHTQDGCTAIMGLNNMDAKIWNNQFSGTGAVGVYLDGDAATGTYAENIKVMGNNFSRATYSDANVYLGEYTMDCTVEGVASDQVTDNGVDNKIIGVKANKNGPHYNPGMNGHFRNMHENVMRMHRR